MAKSRIKEIQVVDEDDIGVCLWRMSDGKYIGDGEGNWLSAQGRVGDPIIEMKMKRAAIDCVGEIAVDGSPFWIPGSRKISDSEHDDQMERLIDGKIPDPVDQVRQLKERGIES